MSSSYKRPGGTTQRSQNYYKRPRMAPVKPPRKPFFDYRLSKLAIGTFVLEKNGIEEEKGDCRLRFYLNNSNDPLSKQDAIAITWNNGQTRIIFEIPHVHKIALTQKDGYFQISTDGVAQFEKLDQNGTYVISEEDPTYGQLTTNHAIDCYVDMDNPVTQPKWTHQNINEWTNENSKFRQILEVTDAEMSKTFEDVVNSWARTSNHGLLSDRLLFAKAQLCKVDRLFEIITRLIRKESSLGPAIDGLTVIIKDLAEKCHLEHEELEKMIAPVVNTIPEYLILRALEAMWKAEERETGAT
ncbi:5181_t:CDS:2, partial [Acaulospora morrowiae]